MEVNIPLGFKQICCSLLPYTKCLDHNRCKHKSFEAPLELGSAEMMSIKSPGHAPVEHTHTQSGCGKCDPAWPFTTTFCSLPKSINFSPLQPETKIGFQEVDSNQIKLIFKAVCSRGKQSAFDFQARRKVHSSAHASCAISCYCRYSAKHRLRAATHLDTPGACFAIPYLLLLFLLGLLRDSSKAANYSRNTGCTRNQWDMLPNPLQCFQNVTQNV